LPPDSTQPAPGKSSFRRFLASRHLRHPVGILGWLIFLSSVAFHVILAVIHFSERDTNPYFGIWFALVLPMTVVLGAGLIAFGAFLSRRRARRGQDLLVLRRRTLLLLAAPLLVLVLPFLGFTSYQGYHYTSSTDFCSTACHTPMEPQAVAYKDSPHVQVGCTHCHIGEGVGAFVQAKLGGLRQVFETVRNNYPRPIEDSSRSRVPAQETCLGCHSSDFGRGEKLRILPRHAQDEENTDRTVRMVLDLGRMDPTSGKLRGIHWHTSSRETIDYVTTDEHSLEIPWIKVTRRLNGHEETVVFRNDGRTSGDPPPEGTLRRMDCLDCHNRIGHRLPPPDETTSELISTGQIKGDLPGIKRVATRALASAADGGAGGINSIGETIRAHYGTESAELLASRGKDIDQAVAALESAYRKSTFPAMKTDWRTYPDHIGHKSSPGCFRCHEGEHVSAEGRTVSHECATCHSSLEATLVDGRSVYTQKDYVHPFPLEGAHAEVACYQCHDGGPTPGNTCVDCHGGVQELMAGRFALVADLEGQASPHHDAVECGDCHQGAARIETEAVTEVCVECHDEEYARKPAEWLSSLEDVTHRARAAATSPAVRRILDELERLRPVHNVDMARSILDRVATGSENPPPAEAQAQEGRAH
jgi:hypothetical protein